METKVYKISADKDGYSVVVFDPKNIRRISIIERWPEYDGPNKTIRKAWFNEDGELESKASTYDGQSDEEYQSQYEEYGFDTMPLFEDHKKEIYAAWLNPKEQSVDDEDFFKEINSGKNSTEDDDFFNEL
jgi:hypothetical protein